VSTSTALQPAVSNSVAYQVVIPDIVVQASMAKQPSVVLAGNQTVTPGPA
jgi:hypothetical protein